MKNRNMKIRNIRCLLFLLALLVLSACNDVTEYDIPSVDAPVLVSTTPEANSTNVKRGNITVLLEFDKNIFFATKNSDQIALSGATLVSADVIGSSNVFTMEINCSERESQVSINIPEGLITGPQDKPAPAVSLSFTTAALDKTPVMATTEKALKVYDYLLENSENKTLSGMMANVAWNTDEADKVYQWTGKYPALNCFDYVHLAASVAGANWIDYGDITPVKNWADNKGIVAAMWHWNVPKKAVNEGDVLDPNTDYAFYMSETEFNADNATVEGTWENLIFTKDLAAVAAYLKLLHDADIPVLWRPFHEAAGGWFWWGKNADSFKAMWVAMFDYFKAQGLNNLIWVWTTEGDDADWYPGDEYVDIIGRDLYGNSAADCATEYSNICASYGNKMVALSECGYSEDTGTSVGTISEQWAAGARWSWFMPWYDGASATTSHADQEWWQDAMMQNFVITREDLQDLW